MDLLGKREAMPSSEDFGHKADYIHRFQSCVIQKEDRHFIPSCCSHTDTDNSTGPVSHAARAQ